MTAPVVLPCPRVWRLRPAGGGLHFSVVLPAKFILHKNPSIIRVQESPLNYWWLAVRGETHPVRSAPREDVPHHGPAVATSRDAETESSSIIAKFNHLHLRPVTLQLKRRNQIKSREQTASRQCNAALTSINLNSINLTSINLIIGIGNSEF